MKGEGLVERTLELNRACVCGAIEFQALLDRVASETRCFRPRPTIAERRAVVVTPAKTIKESTTDVHTTGLFRERPGHGRKSILGSSIS